MMRNNTEMAHTCAASASDCLVSCEQRLSRVPDHITQGGAPATSNDGCMRSLFWAVESAKSWTKSMFS